MQTVAELLCKEWKYAICISAALCLTSWTPSVYGQHGQLQEVVVLKGKSVCIHILNIAHMHKLPLLWHLDTVIT